MAINPNRLAGQVFLAADGQNFMLSGDAAYSVSSVTRETLTGQDRVHGYSEKPVAGYITATLRDSGGLSVADLNAMSNVTVTLQLANGKTIVGRNMWTVEAQEVKTTDGTIDVRWEGPSVEELL